MGDYGNGDRNPGANHWITLLFNKPDVDKIAEYVIEDMEEWGESVRIIEGYDSPIYANERRIAVRVGKIEDGEIDRYDYHFMMQTSTGTWAEKHGPGGNSINNLSGYISKGKTARHQG